MKALHFLRGLAGLAGFVLAGVSSAQSINIDLDIFFGGPSAGSPAPSSTYGGAAKSSGYWNQVRCTTSAIISLAGLDGLVTPVTYKVVSGSGIGGGSGLMSTTGDYRLLMNDYANVPDEIVFRFSGIIPGRYRVFTYAIDAGGATRVAEVSITDSIGTVTHLSGQGPMPTNVFVEGVTHSSHTVSLTSSVFDIKVRNHVQGPPNASVNGFQIVAVPEPATIFVSLFGIGILSRRRRSQITK